MPLSFSGLVPPLKWHGGKHYLAGRIVALMPSHKHYVEPYAGGLAVLIAKDPEGVSEVVNDLDGRLTNFWKTLQSEDLFAQFLRLVEAIPFSEVEWETARKSLRESVPASDRAGTVKQAAEFFVFCRQSLAGRMKGFATLSRRRTRRQMNEQASAWLTAVEGLPDVHARLRRVVVLCRPALSVMGTEDGEDTLFYLDPPYLDETRTSPDVYGYEMSRSDHLTMLDRIKCIKGKVLLSGYNSLMYNAALSDWNRHEFDLPNNAARGVAKARETEVLWCNF